jgi:hypothetical protein
MLSVEQILRWADAYHQRTGQWPTEESGPVSEREGETWSMINSALLGGKRGLPVTTSLFRLLRMRRPAGAARAKARRGDRADTR